MFNGTESEGYALRRRLQGCDWLISAIERALAYCEPPKGGHLYLERLEIDAGTVFHGRLEYELSEFVVKAILESINGCRFSYAEDASGIPIFQNGLHKSAENHIKDVFAYFLRNGRLPWSFHLPDGAILEQVFLSWLNEAKSGNGPFAGNESLIQLFADCSARKRLTLQFSTVFLEKLLSFFSSDWKRTMDEVLQALNTSTEQFPKRLFEQRLWDAAFQAVSKGVVLNPKDLVSDAWGSTPADAPGYSALKEVLERNWPVSTEEPSAFHDNENIGRKLFPDESRDSETTEGIFIGNAGLVLLHPFLPRFFTALSVASEDKLFKPERAVCLLHFLATGQAVAPEYELVLPKILCNIPLETPVEPDCGLTAGDMDEATSMLEAVIRHWDALRSTNPDGLRGTFLLRAGKLSERNGEWLLQVESKAFDILFDRLPWGISMIRLPWMRRMLWVEWQ